MYSLGLKPNIQLWETRQSEKLHQNPYRANNAVCHPHLGDQSQELYQSFDDQLVL